MTPIPTIPDPDITISSEQRAQLRFVLDEALPRECCGVLLGRRERGRLRVRRVLTTLNAVTMVGGFSIPEHEMRRVRLLSAECGLPIIALFHSHQGGLNELSEADRRALTYSEWPWVIVTPTPTAGDVDLSCHKVPT
jgi:proteasome lid subunit RPN8/RPN11